MSDQILSGSGKSTLGFDILLKEGQRQYLESLGLVTFGLSKPPVDSISGLSPTLSVDQHVTNQSPRSTVGTATEVYTYLRVLWARLGHRPCPACEKDIPPTFGIAGDWESDTEMGDSPEAPEQTFPCSHCGAAVPEIGMANFSFNKPAGACPTCTGFHFDPSKPVKDYTPIERDLFFYGSREPTGDHAAIQGWENIYKIVTIGQESIGRIPRSNAATYSDVFTPVREIFAAQPEAVRRGFTARRFSFNVPGGRCEPCEGAGVLAVKMHFLPDVEVRCPACRGRRFNPETLAVQFHGHDIAQVLALTVEEALDLFEDVTAAASHLQVMADVGLGYLQLGQPATTLSGGEAQRVKLAKELGRRTTGHTLYLLDEPTTGLHAADTARLLSVLQRLVDAGNTVLVVEHNLDVIQSADWVIDLGPEGGEAGGRLVAQGTPEQVAGNPESYTGRYLRELLQLRLSVR